MAGNNPLPAEPTGTFMGRDWHTWLEALKQLLALAVVVLHFNLPADGQAIVMVVVYGGISAVQSLIVRPFTPTAIVGFVTALGTAFAYFGLEVRPEVIAGVVLAITAVSQVVVRSSSTPASDPRPLGELGQVQLRAVIETAVLLAMAGLLIAAIAASIPAAGDGIVEHAAALLR